MRGVARRAVSAVSIASVLACAPSARGAEICAVPSTDAEIPRVEITPRGGAPFSMHVHSAVVAYPPPQWARDDAPLVDVLASIRFVGRGDELAYSVARDTGASRGMALLAQGTKLEHVRSCGGVAAADVIFGDEVRAGGVEIPCDAIDLRAGTDFDFVEGPDGDGSEEKTLVPRGHALDLFGDAGAGARSARVHFTLKERTALTLTPIESRGSMTHVFFQTDLGSIMEGWTHQEDLVPLSDMTGTGIGMSGGSGGSCDRAMGTIDDEHFLGVATVRVGTSVLATPTGGPWGTTSAGAIFLISHTSGERAAQILEAAGLGGECDDLDHAFIDASAVSFPSRHRL